MGADPRDRRVQRACAYLLAHGQAPGGGFGWANVDSAVPHCLTGDLVRALIAFGHLDDERVRRAIAWEAGAITGEGHERWYPGSTSAPGFACGINGGLPCGWGAIKAMRGVRGDPAAAADRRGPSSAIDAGARVPARPRPVDRRVPRPTRGSAADGPSSGSRRATSPTPCRGSRRSPSSGTRPRPAARAHRRPRARQAGRRGPVAQRVPLPREALGRGRRAAGARASG